LAGSRVTIESKPRPARDRAAGAVLAALVASAIVPAASAGEEPRNLLRSFTATAGLGYSQVAASEAEDAAPRHGSEVRRFTATAGISYSDGEYGDQPDARILALPLSLKYQRGPWTTRVSVPLVQIRERRMLRSGARMGSSDRGIGDIVASASYAFSPWSDSAPAIALTGKLKLPTADEGLGSDRFEYTTKLELSRTYFDRFTPYLELGYLVRERTSGAENGNLLLGSLGFSYSLTSSVTLGLAHDVREKSREDLEVVRELVPSASIALSKQTRLGLYGVLGLSDASPDLGAGVTLSYRLD
jgi:hypothetical protein